MEAYARTQVCVCACVCVCVPMGRKDGHGDTFFFSESSPTPSLFDHAAVDALHVRAPVGRQLSSGGASRRVDARDARGACFPLPTTCPSDTTTAAARRAEGKARGLDRARASPGRGAIGPAAKHGTARPEPALSRSRRCRRCPRSAPHTPGTRRGRWPWPLPLADATGACGLLRWLPRAASPCVRRGPGRGEARTGSRMNSTAAAASRSHRAPRLRMDSARHGSSW
jgi:hypothetical protein